MTKISAGGNALVYSTYLGGRGSTRGNDLAVDGAGSAYVTGETYSPNFPTTPGAYDTTFNGRFTDAFVTKVCFDATDTDVDGVANCVETIAGSDPLNNASTPEICDRIDNDLDTETDEGFPKTDTDSDGIADCMDPDDDSDGTTDVAEITAGSDPLNRASTPEVCDGVDNDLNDGIDEGFPDTDGDRSANCVDTDDDGDGISDTAEIAAGSDPFKHASTPEVCDGADNDLNDGIDEGFPDTDSDGDGVANCIEISAGSDPLKHASTPEVCDGRDNDLNDGIDEGFLDTDRDGIADCVDADNDNDGFSDATEIQAGSNPLNPASTPEVCDGVDNDLDGIVDYRDTIDQIDRYCAQKQTLTKVLTNDSTGPPVVLGDILTYTVTLRNTGDTMLWNDIIISDPILRLAVRFLSVCGPWVDLCPGWNVHGDPGRCGRGED